MTIECKILHSTSLFCATVSSSIGSFNMKEDARFLHQAFFQDGNQDQDFGIQAKKNT